MRVKRLREQQSKRSGWLRRIPFIAGAVTFLVLIGSGGAWAFWTANVSATGSLSTQSVSVTHVSFPTLSATYLPNNLGSTGTFTVTNTGQVAGVATVQIAAPGPLATKLPIKVWTVASATACTAGATVPGSALSGTWAAPPALTPSLTAGQSVVYCVRTTIPDWTTLTTPTGSQSAQPQIVVSLKADGWIATATAATNTQQTQGMFPLASNFFDPKLSRWFTLRSKANTSNCLDVTASGGDGATVISYGCHLNSNQRWEFVPVSASNQSLVTIRPRHALGTRLSYNSGGAEVLQNASSSTSQQWYVQQASGAIQLVSVANGRCLSIRSTTSTADMPTVPCNDASAQIVLQREPLTFLQTGTSLRFTFGGSNISATATLQRWNGSTWVTAGTAAAGATFVQYTYTTVSSSLGTFLPSGTSTFRIIDASGVVLWSDIGLNLSGTTVTARSGIG